MTIDARQTADPDNSHPAGERVECERALLERVRAGDEGAFEAIFMTYYAALCSFVQSYVLAPDIAEELVQDVFLRIWERRAEWAPPGGVRAYLFTACRNRALDHVKHERIVARTADAARREGHPPGAGQPPSPPDIDAQATELAEALHDAVHELPERRRQVLVLRWEHGLSHAEIAEVLGISVKGVETQLGRAMATLRVRLARFRGPP